MSRRREYWPHDSMRMDSSPTTDCQEETGEREINIHTHTHTERKRSRERESREHPHSYRAGMDRSQPRMRGGLNILGPLDTTQSTDLSMGLSDWRVCDEEERGEEEGGGEREEEGEGEGEEEERGEEGEEEKERRGRRKKEERKKEEGWGC